MKVQVEIKGLTEEDFEKAKKLYAERYSGEEDVGEAALFEGCGKIEDYWGDGELWIAAEIIDEEGKVLRVDIDLNVQELLDDNAFWDAVKDLVEQEEKRQKRIELLKRMIELREEIKT